MLPRVLYYTGRFIHPYYHHQFGCSPTDFDLVPFRTNVTQPVMKSDISGRNHARYRAKRTIDLGIIRLLARCGIPNLRLTRGSRADLIHSSQHLLLSPRRWVVDVEDASVLFWHRHNLTRDRRAQERVSQILRHPLCRRVLPWTQAAKNSLKSCIDDRVVGEKVRVLYPAIRTSTEFHSRESRCPVRVLFVGADFYAKGGLELVRAFKEIRSNFESELTLVTFVPEDVRREVEGVPGVTVRTALGEDELDAEFEKADLLAFPTHIDTFGFVVLEAFARGIPVVATDTFALPEIVDHDRTGVLVEGENSYFGPDWLPRYNPPQGRRNHPLTAKLRDPSGGYIDRLAAAIARLAEDASLRIGMGEAAYHQVTVGRFSCTKRRQTVGQIYAEALQE